MRKTAKYVGLFLLSMTVGIAFGQTSVTATITDPDTQVWNSGTFSAQLIPAAGTSGPFYFGGAVVTSPVKGTMNGSGVLSVSLDPNASITPAGTQWQFTLCPNASAPCQTAAPVTVVGSTQDLSTALSSGLKAVRFAATGVSSAYGYADGEVNPTPLPGGSYYNVTSSACRIWSGSAWGGCSGTSGGITALTKDVTATGPGSVTATVVGINGTLLSGLSTCLLKNTTGTGAPTCGTAGTDYTAATSGSVPLSGNGAGGTTAATAAGLATALGGTTQAGTVTSATTSLGATPGSTLPAGLTAYYDFSDGSGATIHDISGANFCSSAPCNITITNNSGTWQSPYGYLMDSTGASHGTFPSPVTFPQSFVALIRLDPYCLFIGSTHVTSPTAANYTCPAFNVSFNLKDIIGTASGTFASYARMTVPTTVTSPDYVSAGTYSVSTQATNSGAANPGTRQTFSGYQCVAVSQGNFTTSTGTDAMYAYQSNGGGGLIGGPLSLTATGTRSYNTSGALSLYWSTEEGFNTEGIQFATWYGLAMAATTQWTQQQVAQACGYMFAKLQASGTPTSNQNVNALNTLNGTIFSVGDSQSADPGNASVTTWPYLFSTAPAVTGTWNYYTTAQFSLLAQADVGRIQQMVIPNFSTTGPNIVISMDGVNDLLTTAGNTTPAAVEAARVAQCNIVHGAGGKYISATLPDWGTTYSANLQTLAGLIRADTCADAVADVSENPFLGSTGAYQYATDFQQSSGPYHLTNAGQLLVSPIMNNAINALNGSTRSNPTQVTLASANYTMLAADNFVLITATGTGSPSLQDCTGYSGNIATKHIYNAGSATVTVGTQNSETITGTATIAAGTGATFTSIPNAYQTYNTNWGTPPTPGCHWIASPAY